MLTGCDVEVEVSRSWVGDHYVKAGAQSSLIGGKSGAIVSLDIGRESIEWETSCGTLDSGKCSETKDTNSG